MAKEDYRDERGRTPLHWAAWDGSAIRVSSLLEAGDDPAAVDSDGETPAGLSERAGKLGGVDAEVRQQIAGMLKGAAEARALENEALPGKDAKARKV
jgi:hypothetical protein